MPVRSPALLASFAPCRTRQYLRLMSGRLGTDDRERLQDMAHRVSTLYWNSERSVNSIAEELGLSKGRLYELIRPLAVGGKCPDCHSELVFENRTARDREDSICLGCEGEDFVEEPLRSAASRYQDMGVPEAGPEGHPGRREGAKDRTEEADPIDGRASSGRRSGVLAGFLLGTVTGILIGASLRR